MKTKYKLDERGFVDLSDLFKMSLSELVIEYKKRRGSGDWFAHRIRTDFILYHPQMGENSATGKKYRKQFGLWIPKYDGSPRLPLANKLHYSRTTPVREGGRQV